MWIHVVGVCLYDNLHTWRAEDDLQIQSLSLHHAGTREKTQVIKFGRRHLFQASHVAGPDWIHAFLNFKTRKIIFAKIIYCWRGLPIIIFHKSILSFFRKIHLFNVYLTKITLRKIQVFQPIFWRDRIDIFRYIFFKSFSLLIPFSFSSNSFVCRKKIYLLSDL